MKNPIVFLTALMFLFLSGKFCLGSPLQTKTAIGTVVDESGAPVPNVNVSVAGSEFYLTDAQGSFKMAVNKKLTLPFKVVVIKEGYQLKTFTLADSELEIEIVVKKVPVLKTIAIRFQEENKKAIQETKVTIDGDAYKTDRQGKVVLENGIPFSKKSTLSIEGYQVQGTGYNEKENVFEVSASKKAKAEPVQTTEKEKEVITVVETDTLSQELLSKKVFMEYKGGVEEVTKEIIAEQIRVEGNNEKIRNEILNITERLQKEKNLSPEQRKELNNQVINMETMVLENTKAFEKSQERTNFLILKLKSAISEKDFKYEQALKKIALVEKENRITERKFRRNLIIFSIITCTLLLLAIVFYSIARKMRNHRKELMQSNQEMLGIKDLLAKRTEELQAQAVLIEEQQKQLGKR